MTRNYLLLLSILMLLASLFTSVTVASQPPVITDTLYVGQIGWGPRRADPVRAYDTASGELLFNVYDTLIAMNGELYWDFVPSLATNVPTRENIVKTVTNTTFVNMTNPAGSQWSDGSVCIGWVDNNPDGTLGASDVLYLVEAAGSYRTWFVQSFNAGPPVSVTLWRGRYIFHIRIDPVINFVDETGHIADTFDVYDAEYSFKRGLVQDQYGSPMWMFYKPLFDQMNSDFFASNVTEPTAMSLSHLIDNAIEVSGNDLIINVGIPFPDTAFKQILAQTWGSIVSKQFSISIGCWNGDLFTDGNGDGYPDWWTQWRHISRSPYDTTSAYRYVGTGPYRVAVFDSVNKIVKLTRNANYWRGWPAFGVKSYLETVEIRYIAEWTNRKTDFIVCDLDICAVPSAYKGELLDEHGEPIDPKIKTIKYLSPILVVDAAFFNLGISPTSGYIGSGQFPDGIPPNFFNNTHVRRAFAYGFNHTKYLETMWSKEAVCRETPLVYGLVPDYYTKGPDPPYTYDVNYDMAKQELQKAIFNGISVWDSGFYCRLTYYVTSDKGRFVCEMLRDFFAVLSTYEGRTGPPFQIDPTYYDPWWPIDLRDLTMWSIGWLADFADADNYVRPFMHSNGDFSSLQNYTVQNGWTTPGPRTGLDKDTLIDLALKTPDTNPNRAIYYADLDDIYLMDCPSFPIAQPLGRRWQKYWVKGWYYNPLYPYNSYDYYYRLYKEDACWADITGQTANVPDGMCNMRDIGYICGCFGAKAPDPAKVPPQDPKWGNGTYGAGCADVYGDRRVDMRDIGFACAHFGHTNQP